MKYIGETARNLKNVYMSTMTLDKAILIMLSDYIYLKLTIIQILMLQCLLLSIIKDQDKFFEASAFIKHPSLF